YPIAPPIDAYLAHANLPMIPVAGASGPCGSRPSPGYHAPVGTWATSLASHALAVRQRCRAVTGYPRSGVTGRAQHSFLLARRLIVTHRVGEDSAGLARHGDAPSIRSPVGE